MGVLGWTPKTVMQTATLQDLADALSGYAAFHGIGAAATPVTAEFLRAMMQKFPDKDSRK